MAEVNEIKIRKEKKKNNEAKSWFSENINKIDKSLEQQENKDDSKTLFKGFNNFVRV